MQFLLLLFLIGQLVRIPVFGGALTPLDIGVVVMDLWLLLNVRHWFFRISAFPWTVPYRVFLGVMIGSLGLAFARGENVSLYAFLYLLRFLAYQGVWVAAFLSQSSSLLAFRRGIFLFAMLGFVQMLLLPDLTPVFPMGWDPHFGRLTSTLFDPNFSGWVLAIGIISSPWKTRQDQFFGGISAFALLLTFSRSAIGAFVGSIVIAFLLLGRKIFLVLLLLLILFGSVAFFVRLGLEQERQIIREKSFAARWVTIARALVLIERNPVFGVGFNRFPEVAMEAGVLRPEDRTLHSATSADNGILFLWATAGSIGVVTYGWWLFELTRWLWQKAEGKLWIAALVGWFLQGQVVNSLFFVPIIFVMYWWLGITLRQYTAPDGRQKQHFRPNQSRPR